MDVVVSSALVAFILIGVKFLYTLRKNVSSVSASTPWIFSNRIPLVTPTFDWEKTEPIKYRPFVGSGVHTLTMKIKSLSKTPQDWFLIENTYLERTDEKKKIADDFYRKVIHIDENGDSIPALIEFYGFCMRFLKERYPMYFKVVNYGKRRYLHNLIRKEHLTLDPYSVKPYELCQILALNLEEDFLILLKDNPNNSDEEYKLKSSSWCFPSGFDPANKFDRELSHIHTPVPEYDVKLKQLMNRFFNRLSPKEMWMRTNWSIQVDPPLMNIASNHGRENEKTVPLQINEINFDKSFVRTERQVLTSLPKLKAKVMTIRTYTTPLLKIKSEGLGSDLSRAIDSLDPVFAHYKNRAKWGNAVKQYMNSP